MAQRQLTEEQKEQVRLFEPYLNNTQIAALLNLTPLEVREARQHPETAPNLSKIFPVLRQAERRKQQETRRKSWELVDLSRLPSTSPTSLQGKTPQEALIIRADSLGLSVRSQNVLFYANLTYVHQVAVLSEADFLKLKNSGRKPLNELREILSEGGLSFGMSADDPLIIAAQQQTS